MPATLETILRRDRVVVAVSLVALCLLAWLYLFHLAADMAAMGMPEGQSGSMNMPGMDMSGMDMPEMDAAPARSGSPEAGAETFLFLAAMWIVMMIGMMLPSAAPTILLFAAVERRRHAAGPLGRTTFFVAGYFLIWLLYSLVAAGTQTTLSHLGAMSAEMAVTNTMVGGIIFVLAGIYEFTPLKDRCLHHCRSPIEWISQHDGPGAKGALRMGAKHGTYCIGCCWMLMLLLFAGGIMNLLWVAAIAALVLVEKVFRGGPLAARLAGVALILAGIVLVARPLTAA